MGFYYIKIKFGNWLYKNCFPLYNLAYFIFKKNNDRDEIQLLHNLISPGFSVLDIGANIGFYSKILSRMVGKNGMVYSFEPNKENYKRLNENLNSYKNIKLFNMAISEKEEVLKLYTSKLLNVDHRTYPVNDYDKIEEVNSNSIENLIKNGEIENIDFIKIDIPGFEIFAFQGMKNILQTKNLKILAEYWPHGFKKAGSSAVELFDFFQELGYEFKLIEKGNLKLIDRQFMIDNNIRPYEFSFNVLIEKSSPN